MDTNEKLCIPVTSSVNDFLLHLKSHPRTILSARYGDGKSYFLNAIRETTSIEGEFTFLTIYPINYQVEENKDIFELVKRDILLQMFLQGMIQENYPIPDSVALSFYLQNNMGEVCDKVLPLLSTIFSDLDFHFLYASVAGLQFIRNLKDKMTEYKQEFSDENKILEFWGQVNQVPSIENDPITRIISENIKEWKQQKNKRVALVFEDMDRIDPAHLFRILNVLSAHMDYGYRCGFKPDDTLLGNKFGVDNIIVVLDYNNLKNIFHHFYGANANFIGYINKFATSGPYRYSFSEKRNDFIYEAMSKVTHLPVKLIEKVLPRERLAPIDLRRIVNSMENVDGQISLSEQKSVEGIPAIPSVKMLRFYVILRRLGYSDDEIGELVADLLTKDKQNLKYFAAYAFDDSTSFPYVLKTKGESDTFLCTQFAGMDKEGDAYIDEQTRWANGRLENLVSYEDIALKLLQYISR